MNTIGTHSYFVYNLTNKNKTVLYTGVTNNLYRRLSEHFESSKPFRSASFSGRYNAYHLVFYKRYDWIKNAIAREKEIKEWRRSKKEALINTLNPE